MADQRPTVLITGANGFIGSCLVRKFLEEGFEVIAGVRKTADLSLLKGSDVAYRYGDVTEPETLPGVVSGVQYIIHNAGLVKARTRERFFEVNEAGTRHLFEAIEARNPDVRRVIYISTMAVAGPSTEGNAVTEDSIPNPVTTYGESKAAGEKAALSFADRFPVVVVRPPGVYGPGDKEILTLFKSLHRRFKPYIGDTSRRLQLVHVDDLARGIFLAVTKDVKSGTIYFIAEKRAYTIHELMDILEKASGRWALPFILPASLFKLVATISEMSFKLIGAVPMLTREKTRELLASWEVSTSRARDELGFESAIPLPVGAEQTFRWYRQEGWL
jgi:dihydroflavonol-4-reductase